MKRIIFSKFSNKYSFKEVLSLLRNNIGMCYLVLNLLAGIIAGSLAAKNADDSMLAGLDFIFAGNINTKLSQGLVENFITSFSSYFIFILAIFLMGLSLWGFLAVPFIVFFRGFVTGLSSGFLCARYGIFGFAFNVFILLPGIFLSSLAVLLMSKESINFSINVSSRFVPLKMKSEKSVTLKTFLARTGIILTVIVVASIIDVVFTGAFSGFFDFEKISTL